MKPNLSYILVLSLFFVGCKSDDNQNNEDGEKSDSIEVVIKEKPNDQLKEDSTIVKVEYKDPDVQEAHVEIVKEFGTQWDFCTCIVKSDSVNKALMEASDEAFDDVMARSDYIDNKCKGLLIQPNGTPEERMKHEKKVKNCLAGRK